MKLNQVLALLKQVKASGDGYVALCPSHRDEHRSLSVTQGPGKILLNCHANKGCTFEDIARALGISPADLFDGERTTADAPVRSQKLREIYDYRDESGALLYQALRYEPKDFRQRKPSAHGAGWEWKLNGTRRVLYRLPELIAAGGKRVVFIVEGEKDVETLRRNGFLAVCNVGGAGKWRDEYSEFLRSHAVCILPDNDEAGHAHAAQVALSLYGLTASLNIVNLPHLPEKGDVTDWFAAGGTAEELKRIVKSAPQWAGAEDESSSDDSSSAPDSFIQPPKPLKACFHGLAGDFVHAVYPHSEADPMAHLMQFLTVFGNVIGRSAHFQVERDKHFCNLFAVLVGNSGAARKGSSWGAVRDVFHGIDEQWEHESMLSGLSSGEGLLYAVRDAARPTDLQRNGDGKSVRSSDEGAADKRALVYESEFVQVLRAQGREGNSLSSYIRNFWDTGNLRSLTKNSPLRTTDAHVSIVGNITPTELRHTLGEVETANGYANRFLWIYVRRSKLLPLGGNLDDRVLEPLRYRLREAVKFAREQTRMFLDTEATQLWLREYVRLETSRTGFLGQLTTRATSYVMRLAMIFALLDCSEKIRAEHLRAALAVWQYCEDSTRYIFGIKTGDKFADKVFAALVTRGRDGMTRKELIDYFNRNVKGEKIADALNTLHEQGLANCRLVRTENARRESAIWRAAPVNRTGEDFYDFNDFIDLYDFAEEDAEESAEINDLLNFNADNDLTAADNEKVVKVVKVVENAATAEVTVRSDGKLFETRPLTERKRFEELPEARVCPCIKCKEYIGINAEECHHCGARQEIPF